MRAILKLYNTLSKTVEDFEPFNRSRVNMFACGPTVYDFAHIGNGRTAITMDLLSRFLRFKGYEVFYLVNITDIDDKIIKKAVETNTDWKIIKNQYEEQYLSDMKSLNIKIDKFARATDYIEDIKKQVQSLIDKDFAYKIDDGIYFEIKKFKDYGKLSGRKDVVKDDAQSRIDDNDNKRGWNDFCLWKFSKNDEPSWRAEFGDGRPGWHIEDTAITEHFFGPQYDIHGGGTDLIFPHHEAELTQMESLSGKIPFVKYWIHGGLLYIDHQRMGKSNKNFYTINEIIQKYDYKTVRLFMLQGHYRSTLNFSFELLESCENRINRWKRTVDLLFQVNSEKVTDLEQKRLEKLYENFIKNLENDLNTPMALTNLEEFIEYVENNGMSQDIVDLFKKFLVCLDQIFGIDLNVKDIDDSIKNLIVEREKARLKKDWAISDRIRHELLTQNIALNDTDNGSFWYRV